MKKVNDFFIRFENFFQQRQEIICWISFALFLVVTFVSTMTHEPWIDEIYAWDISKYSISDIFYEMRYEGHFALWSLVLYPFSHIGLSLKTLGIVSWFINALGVGYFLKRAPFAWWSKIALLITLPFLYVNPAISRCYVLIPILVFILADVFQKTQNKELWDEKDDGFIKAGILLALLANTHVYTEGFAGIVGGVLFFQTIRDWKELSAIQKKKRIVAFSIAILGAVIAFLQIAPSILYSSVFTDGEKHGLSPFVFISSSGITSPQAKLLVTAAIVGSGIYLLKRDIISTIIVLVSVLFMVAICVFVYGSGVSNRALMWVYFVLFGLWITARKKSETKVSSILLVILCASLYNPTLMLRDLKDLYSGESRFAYFLKDTINKETPIYSNPESFCCVINDYLPEHNFYNLKNQTKLVLNADRIEPEAEMSEEYFKQIFLKNPDLEYIYAIDCRLKTLANPENIIERFNLPFNYDILYPQTEIQKEYFIQYYLLKVYRPAKQNHEN